MNNAIQHEHGRYRPVVAPRPEPDDNWPYHNKPKNGNDPQYGVKSPKFERHIFISSEQIFFDIDSQLAILADARKNPDGTEDDTLTNATTKFRSMFSRWIASHIGQAKTTMSAFVLEKFATSSMNTIKDKEEVDITLLMPEWYDDTTFQQLTDAVHNYVVNATLFEFLSMRITSKDPVTLDKKELRDDALQEIRKLVNASKPGSISKPFKPF